MGSCITSEVVNTCGGVPIRRLLLLYTGTSCDGVGANDARGHAGQEGQVTLWSRDF